MLPQAILFGRERLEVVVPGGYCVGVYVPRCPASATDPLSTIRQALRSPHGQAPLAEFARGRQTAAILVPGKDRVAGADLYVPALLDELNAGGIGDDAIEITIATGTHARHSDAEIAGILGEQAFARVRWRRHDAEALADMVTLGVTGRGTEVTMDRTVVAADLKILTGRIIPHYFAGFGGGRKALLPGVSSLQTILHNHALTLNPEGSGLHPAIRPCRLAGNPVHEDMVEAARMVGNTFVLNTILNADDQLVAAYAGELVAAHEAGCRDAAEWFQIRVPQALDAVIAAAGGWPYDGDFIQALKTPFDVRDAIRPGGALLWIGQCPGGIKKGFSDWAGIDCLSRLNQAVRANYNLAGHNSILLRELTRDYRVAFWSELPDEMIAGLGMEPVHSLAEGITWLQQTCGAEFNYGVVPYANITHVLV